MIVTTSSGSNSTDRFGAFLALLLAMVVAAAGVLLGKLFSEIPQKYVFLRMPGAAPGKSLLRAGG